MTKKDYQAIAGAIYQARQHATTAEKLNPGSTANRTRELIATVLAADNPRFDRETFVAACEDGNVGRRPKRKERDWVGKPRATSDIRTALWAERPEPQPFMCSFCHREESACSADPCSAVVEDRGDTDALPPCVQAMGCYCAGHARGNPASEACDTREV